MGVERKLSAGSRTFSPLIAGPALSAGRAPQRLFHVLFSRRAGEPATSPAQAWWLPRARERRS